MERFDTLEQSLDVRVRRLGEVEVEGIQLGWQRSPYHSRSGEADALWGALQVPIEVKLIRRVDGEPPEGGQSISHGREIPVPLRKARDRERLQIRESWKVGGAEPLLVRKVEPEVTQCWLIRESDQPWPAKRRLVQLQDLHLAKDGRAASAWSSKVGPLRCRDHTLDEFVACLASSSQVQQSPSV